MGDCIDYRASTWSEENKLEMDICYGYTQWWIYLIKLKMVNYMYFSIRAYRKQQGEFLQSQVGEKADVLIMPFFHDSKFSSRLGAWRSGCICFWAARADLHQKTNYSSKSYLKKESWELR